MSKFNPPQVWCGRSADDVQSFAIDTNLLSPDIFCAGTGPDIGARLVDQLLKSQYPEDVTTLIPWSCYTNRKAFGVSLSLYDRHPITGIYSGDPIADCYAYTARKNNSFLVVADGVNWGDKPKLAARCAVHAAVSYLHNAIFVLNTPLQTTKDALHLMRAAFDVAHNYIMKLEGGLTTLNITVVLPIKDSQNFAICSVNVGDSLTFVFSKRYGMNELSIGSHDINRERDMRDAGGALGPVDGLNPLLVNLTFSITTCEAGDIVFLTTDGISDNFDPVVTKIAVPGQYDKELSSVDSKAQMLPHERHVFSMKGMELVIHEYELTSERDISAQELCVALTEHVIRLTQAKRLVIENPELYGHKYKAKDRKKVEELVRQKLRSVAGKLDHATVVAYEAGVYRGEESMNTSYCESTACTGSSRSSSNRSSVSSNMELSSNIVYESHV